MWASLLILLLVMTLGRLNPLGSLPLQDNSEVANREVTVNFCGAIKAPVWIDMNFVRFRFVQEGTGILCFPPAPHHQQRQPNNCSEASPPGTILSYSCRSFRGQVYQGFINCARSGLWILSLEHANNSLCNLDGPIVNFEAPDIVVASQLPEFTTPTPDSMPDMPLATDYEKMTVQLHNIFRRNHGVPRVGLSNQLNLVAQQIVDSIAFGNDLEDFDPVWKWNPLNKTMNFEMNWYFQVPPSLDKVEAVSNAVQMWYSGFLNYDWAHVEANLEVEDALAFTRVIWKATQLIGVGVSSLNPRNITFVACIYTPGRNIESTNPVEEFVGNVPVVRVG